MLYTITVKYFSMSFTDSISCGKDETETVKVVGEETALALVTAYKSAFNVQDVECVCDFTGEVISPAEPAPAPAPAEFDPIGTMRKWGVPEVRIQAMRGTSSFVSENWGFHVGDSVLDDYGRAYTIAAIDGSDATAFVGNRGAWHWVGVEHLQKMPN